MKAKKMTFILTCVLMTMFPMGISGQTNTEGRDDITKWKKKAIMWVGPHPDDEIRCMGTLSILKANGNKIILVMYTSGNKGSQDLEMTSERLAQIRKTEDEKAMGELGITPDSFIWLGYDDGMLEYVPSLGLTEKICKLIRQYRPDALFSMDPGINSMQLHKTDHRASAFITIDAARAAAFHLYFPNHRIYEGIQPFTVPDYFFYNSTEPNYKVDITDVSDKKIRAFAWYVSQFGAGNIKYVGPEPDQKSLLDRLKSNAESIAKGERSFESFRRVSESNGF